MTNDSSVLAARRAELERRIASLSPAKRALLETGALDALHAGAPEASAAAPGALAPRAPGVPVPMSYGQELLWRLELTSPGHRYNVPRTARLRGPLELAALQRALDALVERHETLRTTFDVVDGDPRQLVGAPRAVPIAVHDLQSLPPSEREAEARRRVRELQRRPFDLARDLQLRASLVRLAPDDHVLLLESHHVVSDASSRGILLRELAHLYDAFREGRASSLPPLPVQYGDFALWQRAQLSGERLDYLLGYWRGQLAGAPPLELPTDRPRSAAPTLDGATCGVVLPLELLEGIRRLSRAHGTTVFMTLLAAFDILLARYARQDDVVVGSPIAGRMNPDLDGIIGYFTNTLVLRTSLAGDPTFAELLARVRDTALGAYEHQDVPYEKLVTELRDGSRGGNDPLFSVLFALQDPERGNMTLGGTTFAPFGVDRGATKFDLFLSCAELASGLRTSFEYRTDLFDAVTIERMLGHLRVLLTAAIERPDERVSRLPLLDESERRLVLETWNDTALDYPRGDTLVELFRAQASRTPNAVAVECNGKSLTYAELDERAGRLAGRLRAAGVGPETVVALYVERSIEMVVAMLAIHRAGGAYLPLDPDYPQSRIELMLADARAGVVVTEGNLRARLPALDAVVVSLDGDAAEIGAFAAAAPLAPDAERLAYLIYTSGSTGVPKGVAVTHRNVVNFLAGFGAVVPLDARSTLVAVTPLSFDIHGLEIFLPLISGARLVVAPRDVAVSPVALAELLASARATHMQATPATWRMLVESGWNGQRGLVALCGGEALAPALAHAVLARGLELWNLYGPTEATIWATMHRVTLAGDDARTGGAVSIGRPMANVQAYVLEPSGAPAPVGVPGELLLGGDGIARGYHARLELTADRFVPDPFATGPTANAPVARLYRTGDLVRWRGDGTLEFRGRLDHQVKLRGHRIELGEIENALAQQAGVAQAVVQVREDKPGDARLVAYVVSDGATPDLHPARVAAWRSALGARLPEYMVPALFVRLERLPLTPNGKIDRKALPAPSIDAAPTTEYLAPRSVAEAQIAEIWEEVLQRRPIGVRDDFFALGGHSLLALRVLARIAERMGARLSLRMMFDAPTVEGLAAQLAGERADDARPSLQVASDAIEPHPGDVGPLTHGQELLWLLQRSAPDSAAYHLPDLWRVSGPLDVEALRRAIEMLVERHPSLRTTYELRDGAPVQVIRPVGATPLELGSVESLDASERLDAARRIARDILRRPFDLAAELPLRAAVVRIAADDHLLALVAHHIASDGWSRGVVIGELAALYDGARRGTLPALPPIPLRYLDWAASQRRRLAGPAYERQLQYWSERLAGKSLAVDLPTDRPRGNAPSFVGARRTVVLPPELLDRLRDLARAHDATLYMVLLAAFQTLLHRYSGQADIVVGTVVAGRSRPELDGVVGYFANTLAMDASFGDDPAFVALLGRVRDTQLAAAEHAEVPFVQVAQTLRGADGPAPSCQIMFALQNTGAASLRLGDATLGAIAEDGGTAKFDLYLSMGEQANGLRAAMQYRTDLFDDATIERMLGHLRVLLEAIVAAPGIEVSRLALLDEPERGLVVDEWNRTATDYPRDALVHELFAQVAARRPDCVAVRSGDASMTYRELDLASRALAARLVALGVRPGDRVALGLERSLGTVVATLATVQTGAAYVPLEPSYPAERLGHMLADSTPAAVVVQPRVADVVRDAMARAGIAAPVLVIDDAGRAGEVSPSERPALPHIAAEAGLLAAYVMYTSGSTGRPKGVVVPHRAIVRLVRCASYLPFSASDVMLGFAPAAFDAATLELWAPLLNGGQLVLAPTGLLDLDALGELVERSGVTAMWLTAALFHQVVEGGLARYRGLRWLLAGGDVLAPSDVRRVLAALPQCTLINGYGPTENTTFTCCYPVPHDWPGNGSVPIGRPISNTRVYVLDAHGTPVPVGVPGELYAGGDGVALGYLGRDDLTAERFVADSFTTDPSARLYRTGDRVRWRADGTLEFLGRLDHQVKIRGFRVEPGEIESVLAGHPAVQDAAVVALNIDGNQPRLVAYYVARPSGGAPGVAIAPLSSNALRSYLRERLPEYMVPAAFVALATLPIGATGKVDRRALPLPSVDEGESERTFTAPRSDTERRLAAIWAEVLGHERVGIETNFFDAGGHSLTAMRIMSRVQEAFGVRLPLTAVFERPTLEQSARLLDELAPRGDAAVVAKPSIGRVARTAHRREATKARTEDGVS